MLDTILYAAMGMGIAGLCSLVFLGFCYLMEVAYNKIPAFKTWMDKIS